MSQMIDRWGVELNGPDQDQKLWCMQLKPPFEPFVEKVKDERGDYLVLRSATLRDIQTAEGVYQAAKRLLRMLNVAMSKSVDADPITIGAVIEFSSDSRPRKHHFLEAETRRLRLRSGMVELILKDTQSNVIKVPPAPSKVQRWMRAAALEPNIGSALGYLDGEPGWSELYKAYESLRYMPHDGISGKEIKRFTRTASVGERHHPNDKHKPLERPMELLEGRIFITQWVSVAVEDVLQKKFMTEI